MTQQHETLVGQLTEALAWDPRVRSAWLHGSLGRDEGDAWSDVDVVVEVDAADRRACMSDYAGPNRGLPDLVLIKAVHGVILSAVTTDWQRFDLMFVTPAELAAMDGAGLKRLLGDPDQAAPARPPVADTGAAARVEALVEEVFRIVGLTPVAVGRQEWIAMRHGGEILQKLLIDLMVEENGIAPAKRGGVKRLNPFLTVEQRSVIEGLETPPARRDLLLAAQLELVALFMARARPLAQRLGVRWPDALEAATRRHLKATLGLEI